jgi:hypothetical protein
MGKSFSSKRRFIFPQGLTTQSGFPLFFPQESEAKKSYFTQTKFIQLSTLRSANAPIFSDETFRWTLFPDVKKN